MRSDLWIVLVVHLLYWEDLSQVLTAIEEVVRFFRDELNFDVCEIHKS